MKITRFGALAPKTSLPWASRATPHQAKQASHASLAFECSSLRSCFSKPTPILAKTMKRSELCDYSYHHSLGEQAVIKQVTEKGVRKQEHIAPGTCR